MSQQQQTQAQGLEAFDENTRRELQHFLEQEQTKARIQTQIHEFTDTCWDLCIKGQPQSRFSRGEQACLANCTDRFLDASLFIVKSLEERKGQMNGFKVSNLALDTLCPSFDAARA
ncbi:Mitochondrial import inner membrane translocase subunit tim8 [Rhodotorula toruloides]